jgi:hypothetical protein
MRRASKAQEVEFRGATQIETDPFIFRWSVSEGGYEWTEGIDQKLRLYPRVVPGALIAHYTPETGLYREFVSIRPARDDIRQFAEKYGDIFDQWDFRCLPAHGGLRGGTALERWKAKIEDMRSLVEIWDQTQDEKRHPELKKIIIQTKNGISYRQRGTDHPLGHAFDQRDIMSYALCALQWEVNRRLADKDTPTFVTPRLTWTPDARPRQRIIFQPSNLLSAMWVRFAQTIAGEAKLKQCAVCSVYFQVGPGGKRQHTDTCSARCRQIKSRPSPKRPKKTLKSST